MASYPKHSIANDKDPLISCSTSLDLDLDFDLVSPSMGALAPILSSIGPNECSF